MEFTVTLTDVEVIALLTVMQDPAEWTRNAIKERARLAGIAIVESETARMIADPTVTEIPADAETIIMNYEPPAVDEPPVP